MSFKSKGQLLYPAPAKNRAERETSLKHDPFEEFREAAYRFRDKDKQPTRLYMPAGSFHAAMASAALDMVGVKKSQIGRLTSVSGERIADKIPIFGTPQIWCVSVRSSDMARTPDIRTLPILPRWCCFINVTHIGSLISERSIMNLLGAAGEIVGVGDGRPEKGKLNNGKFRVVDAKHPMVQSLMRSEATKAQDAGLASPVYYDAETEALLEWFSSERTSRHAKQPHALKASKSRGTPRGKPRGKGNGAEAGEGAHT
jgi:hypothetical protein